MTSSTDERLVACALTDHEGITHHGFRSHSELRDEAKLIGEAAGQTRPQQRELLSSDIDW